MTWPRPAPLASMSRKTSGSAQRQGHRRAERDQHERRPGPARPDRPAAAGGAALARSWAVIAGSSRIAVGHQSSPAWRISSMAVVPVPSWAIVIG